MTQHDDQSVQEAEAYARVRAVSPAPHGRANKCELEVTAIRGTFSIGSARLHFGDGVARKIQILGSWNYQPARAAQDKESSMFVGVETEEPLDMPSAKYLSQRSGGLKLPDLRPK